MLTSLEGGIPFVAATGLTALLVSTASTFKLAFAAEDAPELVVGLAKALSDNLQGQSLLLRARVVFALLGVGAGVAVYHAFTGGPRAGRTSGESPHPLSRHDDDHHPPHTTGNFPRHKLTMNMITFA